MKIIILGAGGIGSLVGALLSKENDVLLVGRKEHVDKINKNGLQITGCINENFKIRAETKIKNIEKNTLIILTTKVSDTEKAINDIKDLIKNDTIILCMQNGLGSEEIVKQIVKCRVLRAITTAGTTFLEAGKIQCTNIGNIYLEDSKISKNLDEIFNKSGLKSEIAKNFKERVWIKLTVNCVMNTLTAIFKVKNGELLKVPELIKSVINEIVLVAKKEGLNFNNEKMYNMVIEILKKSAENKSSMFQDILRGRKTEIDYLNSKIVELGKKYNIKTPVNETLVHIIKFLENK